MGAFAYGVDAARSVTGVAPRTLSPVITPPPTRRLPAKAYAPLINLPALAPLEVACLSATVIPQVVTAASLVETETLYGPLLMSPAAEIAVPRSIGAGAVS